MKIGNISFNPEAFKDVSKEEFIKRYRGELDGADIEEAFKKIQSVNKKTEIEKSKETPKEK